MILEIREVPPFHKNGFVVGCERTREAVVIDPGDEVEDLLTAVQAHGLKVVSILLTHAHIDHITGVARAKAALGAPVYLHKDDLPLYEHAVEQGQMFGFAVEPPPPVDHFYDMRPMRFGDYEVHVHHTPGHCPGGVCLQIGKAGEVGAHLIVGDTLFAGSIGRTDLPGSKHAALMRSIAEVLLGFSDDSIVYPGHGPTTTIGRERRTNPFVLEHLRR